MVEKNDFAVQCFFCVCKKFLPVCSSVLLGEMCAEEQQRIDKIAIDFLLSAADVTFSAKGVSYAQRRRFHDLQMQMVVLPAEIVQFVFVESSGNNSFRGDAIADRNFFIDDVQINAPNKSAAQQFVLDHNPAQRRRVSYLHNLAGSNRINGLARASGRVKLQINARV